MSPRPRVAAVLSGNAPSASTVSDADEVPTELEAPRGLFCPAAASSVSSGSVASRGRNSARADRVTAKWSKRGRRSLGDRVEVGAGAILVGNIRIGNDVTIGPNAVVTTHVPAGAIVASPQSRIFLPPPRREVPRK